MVAAAEVDRLMQAIAERERGVARRATLLTVVPAVLAIVLVSYTAWSVERTRVKLVDVRRQLAVAADSVKILKAEADRLRHEAAEAGAQLTSVATTASEIERFIERKQSFLRNPDEVRFLIEIRMRFDSLNADLLRVAQASPGILDARPHRRWVTIVRSDSRPDWLRVQARRWVTRYGADKVALYRSQNGYYALALTGDGTFTSAYRLTESLQKSGEAPAAYFASATDWGSNLLSRE